MANINDDEDFNDDYYDDEEADDYDYDDDCDYILDYDGSRMEFAGPNSALRAASSSNPRIHPCPNCGCEDRLTRKDVALGYQCDDCADRAERGWDY